jgi:hypothetical protein
MGQKQNPTEVLLPVSKRSCLLGLKVRPTAMTQIGQQGDKALIVSSIPGVMSSVFHASFVLLSLFSFDSLSQEFIFLFPFVLSAYQVLFICCYFL